MVAIGRARRVAKAPLENLEVPLVFVSYEPNDVYWRDRVREHLNILGVQGKIQILDQNTRSCLEKT